MLISFLLPWQQKNPHCKR